MRKRAWTGPRTELILVVLCGVGGDVAPDKEDAHQQDTSSLQGSLALHARKMRQSRRCAAQRTGKSAPGSVLKLCMICAFRTLTRPSEELASSISSSANAMDTMCRPSLSLHHRSTQLAGESLHAESKSPPQTSKRAISAEIGPAGSPSFLTLRKC